MIVQNDPPLHLSYCLNIHPGEQLDDNLNAIKQHVTRVKQHVSPNQRFGLGLRLGHQAVQEILEQDRLNEVRSVLEENQFYAFTINGFPYGTFHQTRVKQQVYQPDWQTEERGLYTCQLIDILAALLPENGTGSISTLPLSYKEWVTEEAQWDAMVAQLIRCVAHLRKTELSTGKEIHLGLEPEPCCLLETTDEVIHFFNQRFIPKGKPLLAKSEDCSLEEAEELIRKHIGVCLDTCHLAIQYEALATSFDRYHAEGIRLSKIHISAALHAENTPEAREAIRPFDEPVYLHQVKAKSTSGEIFSWTDLPLALHELERLSNIESFRVHFHVPLFWEGDATLSSTNQALNTAFFDRIHTGICSHLEIETYTFDVLPAALQEADVVDSISKEFEWIHKKL